MISSLAMSHHTAALAVRERLAMSDTDRPEVLARAAGTFGAAALVTTCNRVEFYVPGAVADEELVTFVAEQLGAEPEAVGRAYRHREGVEAVRHLLRVAAGLDSMVLGESEVLGQVRSALAATVREEAGDAVVTHLFHTAIRTGRRVRRETALGSHSLSVAGIAVRELRDHLDGLRSCRALIVGAGETSRLAAEGLADHGVASIEVANRTLARAEVLAESLRGTAIGLDELDTALSRADVVVTGVGAGRPLISASMVRTVLAGREGAPLAIVDLGVPRDVAHEVRRLAGVWYRDIDDLQLVAERNAKRRHAERSAAEAIVDEQLADFEAWWERRSVVPTIRTLTTWADSIRRRQMARSHTGLSREEQERLAPVLDRFSRALVKQLLHEPITALRTRADRERYAEATRVLFALDSGE